MSDCSDFETAEWMNHDANIIVNCNYNYKTTLFFEFLFTQKF